MKKLYLSVLVLVLAACAPPAQKTVQVESGASTNKASGLDSTREYVALLVDDASSKVGTFTACKYGRHEEMIVSAKSNNFLLVRCFGGDTIHFGDSNQTQSGTGFLDPGILFELSDGRKVMLVGLYDASSRLTYSPQLRNPGRYSVLTWYKGLTDRLRGLGNEISEYRFAPGAIHYLGALDSEASIKWQPDDGLVAMLKREYPILANRSFVVEEPIIRVGECAEKGRGLTCKKGSDS